MPHTGQFAHTPGGGIVGLLCGNLPIALADADMPLFDTTAIHAAAAAKAALSCCP